MKKPKPFNSGQWTQARMKSFIMSALRRARWPVKYEAIQSAFVERGTNPATGKPCKLHKCTECHHLFPQSKMQADHIDPVVPLDGKWGTTTEWLGTNWNELLQRLFCELDGFQPLCSVCHKSKSAEEREQRRANKS